MEISKRLHEIAILGMACVCSLSLTALVFGQAVTSNLSKKEVNTYHFTNNPYRPQFHFSPDSNWTNDPNGLVYFHGEYHLFFQYNPFGHTWGHMSWGHAVSPDMIHWKQLPVAIPEANNVMIFSGSAIVDSNNTSGFGKDGKIPMIAVYAGYNTKTHIQDQRLAYSLDYGRTWTKYKNNPVITLHTKNFRDPKVFWYKPDHHWVMVVALSARHKVRFYSSPDLKHWNKLSDFGPVGATGGVWECPMLDKVKVAGYPSQTKWVLEIGLNPGSVAGGSGGQYFIGDFNGKKFTPDPAFRNKTHWVDYGKDFYAATSWANIPPGNGRTLWLGWMDNWQYAAKAPTHPFRGMMSIPRSIHVKKGSNGYYLVQQPVRELDKLRGRHFHFDNLTVSSGSISLSKKGVSGITLEIEATLKPATAKKFGLLVRKGSGQQTVIGYNRTKQQLYVDRRHSGDVSFSKKFPGIQTAPLQLDNGLIHLHILVDHSSVEVFANGGKRVITDDIYPKLSSDGLQLFADNGSVTVTSLDIWKLKPYRK